jgi:hypothetical protein
MALIPSSKGEWAQFVDQVALGEIGVACLAEKGGRLEGECEGEGLAGRESGTKHSLHQVVTPPQLWSFLGRTGEIDDETGDSEPRSRWA